MTEQRACDLARRRAREVGLIHFVVYAPEDAEVPERGYFVAEERDLDGFYAGCQVVAAWDGR